MTYLEARAIAAELNGRVAFFSDRLRAFPKGKMGLTPDAVKASPDYRQAKTDFDAAFAALRNFNAWYARAFKKEIRAETRNLPVFERH